jgi:hypothetical protein
MQNRLSKNGTIRYLTTENKLVFDQNASQFLDQDISSEHVEIVK